MTNTPTNFGIGALLDELRPYLQQMVAETLRSAQAGIEIPTLIPATVVAVSAATNTITVTPDSLTSAQIPAQSLMPLMPAVGARVMVLFQPPQGVFVVSLIGNKKVIQTGRVDVTFTAVTRVSGTLTFPLPFASEPTVQGTIIAGSFFDMLLNWQGNSATNQITWTIVQKGGLNVTGTISFYWFAYGDLA